MVQLLSSLVILFFREFQPMVSAPNNSSLLSDQDTNHFLVQVGIDIKLNSSSSSFPFYFLFLYILQISTFLYFFIFRSSLLLFHPRISNQYIQNPIWQIVIDFNLKPPLKLLSFLSVISNNLLPSKIYCKSVVKILST